MDVTVSPMTRKQMVAEDMLPVLYNGYGRKVSGSVQPLTHDSKGFIATLDDPQMLFAYQKLKVEANRMNVLVDCRTILDEAGYIESLAHGFVTWATAERPTLLFRGKSKTRAEQLVNDMLERIGYWKNRHAYIYNGIYLELFLKKEVSWDEEFMDTVKNKPLQVLSYIQKGGKLGSLDSLLGPLPAETMFRNSNHQDRFDEPAKSFCQIPEPYNSAPGKSQSLFNIPQEWFHFSSIMHPRWNHLCNKAVRYSRPALMPIRKAYNRAELGGTDAAVARHLASSRVINYSLNANLGESEREATPERIKEMRRTLEQLYPQGVKAGTFHVSSGADKLDVLDSLNLQLSKPEDLRYHLDLVFMSMLEPPQLAGYTGGEGKNINGPTMEQLRRKLEVNVKRANDWEGDDIILPLCYFELFLNGIYDVEVTLEQNAASFDNKAVERKNDRDEVAAGTMSPQTYFENHTARKVGHDWPEEERRIIDYKTKIGDATPSSLESGDDPVNKPKSTTASKPSKP